MDERESCRVLWDSTATLFQTQTLFHLGWEDALQR
jgi:hypothetical protein